jgi:hypothetical protein
VAVLLRRSVVAGLDAAAVDGAAGAAAGRDGWLACGLADCAGGGLRTAGRCSVGRPAAPSPRDNCSIAD